MGWAWDERLSRYRDADTGKFLPGDQVRAWNAESIAASQNVSSAMAKMVSSGEINIADWESKFREEIKGEYIRQYLDGIGGQAMMTQKDWGSLGGMLGNQYHEYLRRFSAEIAAGNLSEAQIKARMDLYISSAKQAYEKANGRSQVKAGMTEERWVLNPELENCDDCFELANMGWVPIPEISKEHIPGDAGTQCRTNCGCRFDYRQGGHDARD